MDIFDKVNNKCFYIFSIIIFLLSTVVIYYFYSFSSTYPSYIFWILSTSIFILIFVQICNTTGIKRIYEYLLIFEILYVRSIYTMVNILTVPYGLFGRDVHSDYTVAKLIEKYSLQYIQHAPGILLKIRDYSKWPMIHLLAVITNYVTEVPLFKVFGYLTITKLLPVTIFSIGLLFYYLGQRKIYGIKVASTSVLLVSFVFYNLIFHSWFVRETYAYVIFLYLFYLIVAIDKNKKKMLFLSIIGILNILFAHHLTAFTFIIFLGVLGLSIILLRGHLSSSLGFIGTLLIISSIGFISYALYIGEFVFNYLVSSILALFNPAYSQPYYIKLPLHSAALLKYKIQVYLTLFYISIFTLIGIHKLVHTKKQTLLYWDFFGIFWGILISLMAVINRIISNLPNIGLQRLLSFSWPFFVSPSIDYIFTKLCDIKRKNVKNTRIVGIVVFIVSFLLFNLYMVPSYIYNAKSTPNYVLNEVSMKYSASHYLATYWFLVNTPVNVDIYGDTTINELFGGLGNRIVRQNIDIYKACDKTYFGGKWLAIRMENFNVIRCIRGFMKMPYSHLTTNDYYCIMVRANKLYDGEDIQLFKFVEGS